jgi:hypothetical protein
MPLLVPACSVRELGSSQPHLSRHLRFRRESRRKLLQLSGELRVKLPTKIITLEITIAQGKIRAVALKANQDPLQLVISQGQRSWISMRLLRELTGVLSELVNFPSEEPRNREVVPNPQHSIVIDRIRAGTRRAPSPIN